MDDSFDLAILIVNWNGREMLHNLLASIDQTSGTLRVQTIVVDNASTDASVDNLAGNFPNVLLIRNDDNRGFASGNNQAAQAATAPLLLLLNNDVVVRAGSLQALAEFLNANPSAIAVGPKLIGGDGQPQRTGRNPPTFFALLNSIQFLKWTGLFRKAYRRYRRGNFDPNVPGPIGQLAAAALLIRAKAFKDCGRFDEGFEFGVEDVDLCARLAPFGSIYYLPEAVMDHLGRVSSRANRGFVYRGYECGWARYLSKHHGMAASLAYKMLVTIDMPVRLATLCVQLLISRLKKDIAKTQRLRDLRRAATEFAVTGLPRFWRA